MCRPNGKPMRQDMLNVIAERLCGGWRSAKSGRERSNGAPGDSSPDVWFLPGRLSPALRQHVRAAFAILGANEIC